MRTPGRRRCDGTSERRMKLAADNRRDAVRRARQQGIIT